MKLFAVRCLRCNAVVLEDVPRVVAEHVDMLQQHYRTCTRDRVPRDLGDLMRHYEISESPRPDQ